MDSLREFPRDDHYQTNVGVDAHETDDAIDAPPVIGSDERRMHVRAYNHWVAMRGDRSYPSAEDLELEGDSDFGPNSVLIDFTSGMEAPGIAFLGSRLRTECGIAADLETLADVPPRSLLSRLTDHYLQIIANHAPIGFEAEFVNARGHNTMYRGILMPLSSDDDTIDFVHGVINWKEELAVPEADVLEAEVTAALAAQAARPPVAAWADGPSSSAAVARPQAAPPIDLIEDDEDMLPAEPVGEGLADWLATARAGADVVKQADGRSRAALYHALGLAYDFALLTDARADEYVVLLADAGIVTQARAPMTPVVKLVFGADYDKTRLTEFAAALSYGRRHGLPTGGMRVFLDQYPGGLKAIVAADRRERRPEGKVVRIDAIHEAARALEAQLMITLPGDEEFVILVARRVDADRVAVVGIVPDDKPLIDRALRYIVG